jgi:hypothetical protein
MIDITPETERLVREEAAGVTDGKERAREFVKWAKSHPDTPPLSDEAISRASLNPDR